MDRLKKLVNTLKTKAKLLRQRACLRARDNSTYENWQPETGSKNAVALDRLEPTILKCLNRLG